jgi:hypothetical protein
MGITAIKPLSIILTGDENWHDWIELVQTTADTVTALDFLQTCDLTWRSPDRPPMYIRSVVVLPPTFPFFLP